MDNQDTSGEALHVLAVGGAGYVGTILRPALEAAHHVRYLDLEPVSDAGQRMVVGSVTDAAAVERAVTEDLDAVVYLAMGQKNAPRDAAGELLVAKSNFDVNAYGVYRVLHRAMEVGVPRFIYASSMGVLGLGNKAGPVDETVEPDAWGGYGLSKRLGECVCEIAARRNPQATITALRLMHPMDADKYRDYLAGELPVFANRSPTAPEDLRRLFLAALALDKPGLHIVQASGDAEGTRYPNHRVHELLGWWPQGR